MKVSTFIDIVNVGLRQHHESSDRRSDPASLERDLHMVLSKTLPECTHAMQSSDPRLFRYNSVWRLKDEQFGNKLLSRKREILG